MNKYAGRSAGAANCNVGRRGCGLRWGERRISAEGVKQRFGLKMCDFANVLGTLAKLGFRRHPVRPQELKPRKTYDLEGLWRPVCGGSALVGAR